MTSTITASANAGWIVISPLLLLHETLAMAPATMVAPVTMALPPWVFGKMDVSPPTFRNTRKYGSVAGDPSA